MFRKISNTTVIRIVRVRVCHFVAAGAQLRRRRVQQQAELVRILLSDIIQAVIQNAADAMGRTVNVGNGIGFQRSLEHSVGAGVMTVGPSDCPKIPAPFNSPDITYLHKFKELIDFTETLNSTIDII